MKIYTNEIVKTLNELVEEFSFINETEYKLDRSHTDQNTGITRVLYYSTTTENTLDIFVSGSGRIISVTE